MARTTPWREGLLLRSGLDEVAIAHPTYMAPVQLGRKLIVDITPRCWKHSTATRPAELKLPPKSPRGMPAHLAGDHAPRATRDRYI
jgi:hypothetical protein